MRQRLLIAALPLLLVAGSAFTHTTRDESEVRAALDHYLQGHATGQGSHFRLVFHPDAKLFFNRDGKLTTRTAEEYISGASGSPAPDEAQRRRRIVRVEVTGDAAQAKIELDHPTVFITDYFNLLRVDGKWMIVNKTFTVRNK